MSNTGRPAARVPLKKSASADFFSAPKRPSISGADWLVLPCHCSSSLRFPPTTSMFFRSMTAATPTVRQAANSIPATMKNSNNGAMYHSIMTSRVSFNAIMSKHQGQFYLMCQVRGALTTASNSCMVRNFPNFSYCYAHFIKKSIDLFIYILYTMSVLDRPI